MRALLRSALGLSASLAMTASTSLASADIAPPPGYVEACTVAKQQSAGQECYSCAAYHGNADHCSASLAQYGFAEKCKTRGASVWSEVWCRGASPKALHVPPEVLGQLSDSSSKVPRPSPSAPTVGEPAVAAPPSSEPIAPLPSPTADAEPTATPTPPPVPPPGGSCGACVAGGKGSSTVALALGLLGVGIAALRRRDRRG